MSGGGYRGGSKIISTGNSKSSNPRPKQERIEDIVDARRTGKKPLGNKKKIKGKMDEKAPGLHVLSLDNRRKIMRKVNESRQQSEAKLLEKRYAESERRRLAFQSFVKAVKSESKK